MRKTTVFFSILLLTVCTVSADRLTFDNTKTQVAMPLDTPPTIDGVIDLAGGESWVYAGGADQSNASTWYIQVNAALDGMIQGGVIDNVANAPADNTEFSYRVWVGYDKDNLYVAVRVADNTPNNPNAAANSANGSTWMDDSVEVFVDGDNSNFPTRDTTGTNAEVVGTGGQFVITANNAYREAEAGNPGYGAAKAWYALTSTTDTGYDAEFRISMSKLGNPKQGDLIGFSVAVNDNFDGSTTRQVIWSGQTHVEATYGNLLLGPRTYTAPKVASAPKVDGKIDPTEYTGAKEIKINTYNGVYDLQSGNDTWPVTDHAYSAWVVHTNDSIYVALDCTDDTIVTDTAEAGSDNGSTWEDDSAEIFFDGDHDRSIGGSGFTFEGQYVLTPNGARRENEAQNPTFGETDDWFGGYSLTSKGYQLEFKVKKAAIGDPKDGSVIGFNMCQNDDDGAGRKCQLMWEGRAHSEQTYGELTLSPTGGTSVNDWSVF